MVHATKSIRFTRRTTIAVASVVALSAIITGAFGFAAQGGATASIAPFETPATGTDALPEQFDPEQMSPHGMKAETSRFLGATDDADFWAVSSQSNEICLVALIKGPAQVGGSVCTAADQFNRVGTYIQVAGPDGALEAYLMPDDTELVGATSSPVLAIGDNLFITDPYDPSERPLTILANGQLQGIASERPNVPPVERPGGK